MLRVLFAFRLIFSQAFNRLVLFIFCSNSYLLQFHYCILSCIIFNPSLVAFFLPFSFILFYFYYFIQFFVHSLVSKFYFIIIIIIILLLHHLSDFAVLIPYFSSVSSWRPNTLGVRGAVPSMALAREARGFRTLVWCLHAWTEVFQVEAPLADMNCHSSQCAWPHADCSLFLVSELRL